ncbi:MAG: FimB/Mfa2 family fimbrial subunit [Prevotellaceae bacterium]|jgi:hypothetical protein|nr:FimB/Mfa2 family fimbrial subunit [Prevotellaceae bacterium]
MKISSESTRYLTGIVGTWCLLTLFSACIHDNREDCPQGIHVQLYSATPCSTDTIYPAGNALHLYVFDNNGVLVATGHDGEAALRRDYTHTLQVSDGLFTVLAWMGVEDTYFDTPADGKSVVTREDVLFRLRRTAQRSVAMGDHKVYYGESEIVYLPNPEQYGSIFKTTRINLQEQTNRINVTVEGLAEATHYEVVIESRNGAMTVGGKPAADKLVEYPAATQVTTDGVLQASFTTLKLLTGLSTTLVVRSTTDGTELYRGDLLGTLLLKNPDVDLACDHDFNIAFTTADQCGCGIYTLMEIWVNNWLVHSYSADLK